MNGSNKEGKTSIDTQEQVFKYLCMMKGSLFVHVYTVRSKFVVL